MTKEIKHTMGPWSRDSYGHIVDSNGQQVLFRSLAILASSSSKDEILQAEANTDLVASAPDLLDELRRLVERIDDEQGSPTFHQRDMESARAAIARATGISE